MWFLFRQSVTHIIRSRLFFLVLIFSFFIQFVGIHILHSATIHFQGVLSRMGPKEGVFVSLFFELFTGAFLSAVFGIWLMPYAHQGSRSALTFTLPISKWYFALSYSLSMLALLIVQHVMMLTCYGLVFGFTTFLSSAFPWQGLISCLLLETLAFEVLSFAFAISSMTFGQIPTFFLGTIVFFLFQLGGAFFKIDLEQYMIENTLTLRVARLIYQALPPLGELVFDLRHGFATPSLLFWHSLSWAAWLGIFAGLFRWKTRFPAKYRSSEV